MPKLKSHKTVEEIARKHRLDVSFIQKQLDMGEPIEHEHTKDHDLARDIALQHLDEIPDYYTRLKKMEADAKKHHKKFKDVKEHCGCEEDAVKELEESLKKLDDTSYDSIDKLMRRIMKKYDMSAKQLHNSFVDKHDKTPDDWVKGIKEGLFDRLRGRKKIGTTASGKGVYVSTKQKPSTVTYGGKTSKQIEQERKQKKVDLVRKKQTEKGTYDDPWLRSSSGGERRAQLSQLRSEEKKSGDEGLHDWFNKSKSSDGKKGWVQLGGKWAGKPCARQPGQTSTPKCGSSKMKRALSKDEEEAARRRKNIQDPNQPEKTGGAKPTNVRTESMNLQEVKDKPGKGSGKKDACYHKVKSRYDVWPSAYASGALVKCRKVGAANWGTKSEAIMQEERYCPLCDKRETRSQCSYGTKVWDKVAVKDEEYSMARSELATIANAVERLKTKVENGEGNLEAWVQSKITKAADYIDTVADYIASGEMEEACWSGYKQVGMKKKGKKIVPNCVPTSEETIEDAQGNTFAEVVDLIKPEPIKGFKSQVEEATRLQAQTGNVIAVTLSWRGKYYSLKMFFPQTKLPTRKELNDEIQKVYPGSVVVYHAVSEIQPGQPLIQAFGPQGGSSAKPGPNKNYVKTMGEETEVEEDWQKVNRQDKTAGLSKTAVAAYRRENPGSKLQTAVTEKNPSGKRAKRRASFCRRMKGMKSKLTSAKTARDPDSNINKALRRWNCN